MKEGDTAFQPGLPGKRRGAPLPVRQALCRPTVITGVQNPRLAFSGAVWPCTVQLWKIRLQLPHPGSPGLGKTWVASHGRGGCTFPSLAGPGEASHG